MVQQNSSVREQSSSPPPGNSSESDREERVTDKMKKASIANMNHNAHTSPNEPQEHPLSHSITADSISSEGPALFPRKKRSYDDLQNEESAVSVENGSIEPTITRMGQHKRMRSRDISSGEYVPVTKSSGNEVPSPLAEENDLEAEQSPGGPGILVDAPQRDSTSPTSSERQESKDNVNPKKKRSREEVADPEGDSTPSEPVEPDTTSQLAPAVSRSADGEPEKKRHRDEAISSTESAKQEKSTSSLPPSSAFANSSVASPFGSVSTSKEPSKSAEPESNPTSSSAFASSGLSAFASSSKSPFAAGATASSSGGFGNSGTAPKAGLGDAGATSPFASSRTTGFSSLGSGFGSSSSSGFGGGFGSATTGFGGGFGSSIGSLKPLSGGLSSFASSGTVGFGGSSKQKAFGAQNSDEEGSGPDADAQIDVDNRDAGFGEKSRSTKVPEKPNTGEENEETTFSCRAKLYHFEGEWKERGVGTLKLNETIPESIYRRDQQDDELEHKRKARLIMRSDGVHRVILNTPVLKGMKFGTVDGEEPSGKTMTLQGFDDTGKAALYSIKIGKEEVLKELWKTLKGVQDQLEAP